MIELDQQGSNKIQISEHANVAPNKCANCSFSGREPGRYFIDFGVDLEFYGTVYLCTECFAECANIIGWIPPAEADRLKLRDAKLTAEFERLKEFEAKYVSIASHFDIPMATAGDLSSLDSNSDHGFNLVEEVILNSIGESGSVNLDAAELLGTPTKSASKRGSANVPNTTGDESRNDLSL